MELLLKKEMTELDFCNDLLRDGTKKRNVKKINPNDKSKWRWEIEDRWASLFKNSDKKLKSKSRDFKTHHQPIIS